VEPQRILDQIEALARRHLGAEEKLEALRPLRPEMRLAQELELDSLDMTTLAIEVEEHFGILLDAEDEEQIETLGDLVAAIRRQLED
jgi:acyl carrier protein